MDTQKDTLITTVRSAGVDESIPGFTVEDIHEVSLDGKVISQEGYIDIGLIDTMEDLFVNFIGAGVFSVFSFFYVKNEDRFVFIQNFIPKKKEQDKDYLEQEIKNRVEAD